MVGFENEGPHRVALRQFLQTSTDTQSVDRGSLLEHVTGSEMLSSLASIAAATPDTAEPTVSQEPLETPLSPALNQNEGCLATDWSGTTSKYYCRIEGC